MSLDLSLYGVIKSKSKGSREFIYLEDFEVMKSQSSDPNDLELIYSKDMSSFDIAEIASFNFEQANYHELVDFPLLLVKTLRNENVPEFSARKIIKEVCEKMLHNF